MNKTTGSDSSWVLGCGCFSILVVLLLVVSLLGPYTIRIHIPCVEIDQTQIYECTIK